MQQYIIDLDLSGRSRYTVINYRIALRPLLRHFGAGAALAALTPESLRVYLGSSDRRHPFAYRRQFVVLRAFLNWCVRQGYLDASPLKVQPPKVPDVIKRPLTEAQHQAALKACDQFEQAERDRAMLMVLWDSGIRVGELASMSTERLDLRNGTVLVLGKGQKEREVRVRKATASALWQYIRKRRNDQTAVWLGQTGAPLQERTVQREITRVMRAAGIRQGGAHLFRHTFATRFMDGGNNPLDLQYLLGHTSLRMVDRYSRSNKAQRALAAHARFLQQN